jgi:RNA polymerase sigma factor (sigma-70 family)
MGEMMSDDMTLVGRYARSHSEEAFAALVSRHLNLVYSVALRRAGDAHLAEDITQAVFIILSRKAGSLSAKTVVPGWLCRTARHVSENALTVQRRRAQREQEAAMQSFSHEPEPDAWQHLAPLLDSALAELREKDQDAVVLRFFEGRSLSEVGQALGVSEMAAGKRVNRALEKLRRFFTKRGVALSAATLGGAMATHAVEAAPVDAASTVTATILSQGAAASASTLALVKVSLSALAWMRWRILLGFSAVILVSGGALGLLLLNRPPASPPGAAVPATGKVVLEEPIPSAPREPFTRTIRFTMDMPLGGVAVQPDGKILAGTTLGGFFVDEQSGTLGYYTRGALRFETNGALDRSFYCTVDRSGSSSAMVAHIALHKGGRIFLTGLFNTVDDRPRPGQAVLLADGSVDESYEPWRGRTNTTPLYQTSVPAGALPGALLEDGSVAVMSGAIEGPRAPYPGTVYRLDASGRLIAPAQATLAGGEFSRPSGLVTTLGPVGFWARKAIDWTRVTPANRRPPFQAGKPASDLPGGAPVSDLPFERWTEPPSSADAAVVLRGLFEEVPLELCRYAVRLPDGGVILAVRDEVVNGSMKARGRFMRFDKDWHPDFSFTNRYEADLRSYMTLKRQQDGKFLVGGLVGTINGEAFTGLVRLEQDGAIDRSFRCETATATDGRAMDIALQSDGRIVIGGFFSQVNGVNCPHLARLNPDGSLDRTFQPPFMPLKELSRKRMRVQHLTQPASAPAAAPGASATPSAESAPETVLITSLRIEAGTAVLEISGMADQLYILQARNDLNTAQWSNLSTNRTDAKGTGMFRDEEAKNHGMRSYRIARPWGSKLRVER